MTVTCTYNELLTKLQSLTAPGTYRVVITDPQNVVLGSSSTDGTLGNKIKSCAEDHIKNGVYLDLSSSDLTLAQGTSLSGAFQGCTQLTDIDDLPRNISSTNYANMFEGCTALRTASVSNLPINASCVVDGMFAGCVSLVVLTVDKAFVKATENATNLLADCTALKQIVVSDVSKPAVINKDTQIKGDFAVQGDSIVTGKSTFKDSLTAVDKIYGTGTLIRDAEGNLVQEGTEYKHLTTLTEESEKVDSFIGNATSASKLNHTINLRLNGEITGFVEIKTHEKDGEVVVENTLKTEVNSLNSTDADNNIYKIVTKDYLNQQLSKIKTSTMLKVDEISETSYKLGGKSYTPSEGVIYLVPSEKALNGGYSTADGYKTDKYNSYEEYIWETSYEPFTETKTSTGVLETVRIGTGTFNVLSEITINDSNVTNDGTTKKFSYDGLDFALPTITEQIVNAETKSYTITSNNADKVQGVSVSAGNIIKSIKEAQVKYVASEDENGVIILTKYQEELKDIAITTTDKSDVEYTITETIETLVKTGDYSWEHIGNTAMNLTDYLTNTKLEKGFAFKGNVTTTKDLDVEGSASLGGIFTVNAAAKSVTVDSAFQVNDSLTATGDASIGGALSVTGDTSANGDLDVTGDSNLTGTLDVTGATTLTTLTVSQGAELQSTLAVKGAATLDKTLEVKETATFDQAAEVKGNLIVGTYTTSTVTDGDGNESTVITPTYDATITGKLAHKINVKQTVNGVETTKTFDNTEDIDLTVQQSTLTTETTDDIADVSVSAYDGSANVTNTLYVPDQNVNKASEVEFGKVDLTKSVDDVTVTTSITAGEVTITSDKENADTTTITDAKVTTAEIETATAVIKSGDTTANVALDDKGNLAITTSNATGTLLVNGKAVAFGQDTDVLIARLAALEAKVEAFFSSYEDTDKDGNSSTLTTDLLSKWGVTGNVNTSSASGN